MVETENIDWQRIVEIPFGLRHIIVISMSTALTFIGWYWAVLPLSDMNVQRQHELATTKQLIETYQQRLVNYSTLDLFQHQLHLLNSTLQQYQDVIDPLNPIASILSQSGSQLVDIKKLPPISENGFTVFRWTMKNQADYFQFMSFIHLINASPYLITVERLIISGDTLLTLDMTIHLHQLNTGTL